MNSSTRKTIAMVCGGGVVAGAALIGVGAPAQATPAPTPHPIPLTLSQESAIVSQARRLLPLPPRKQRTAKLILTESRVPEAGSQGASTVRVDFESFGQVAKPVTIYETTGTLTGKGHAASFTPMSSRPMPGPPDLAPFTIAQFKASPRKAEEAALAANPNIDASVVDMRNSPDPRERLGYVFGTDGTGFVSVDGITGKVTAH